MEQVVISGAGSMLGLALIEQCLRRQTKVIAIVRNNSSKLALLPQSPYITIVECNLDDMPAVKINLAGEIDVFYHFAWEQTENANRNKVELQHKNLGHTLNAVHLAKRLGCKKFIGAGSQAEYGRVADTIRPDMRAAPDSAYGVAKYAAGRMAAILCEQLNMEFVWTRIFSIYGINDMPSTMIMYCIACLLHAEVPQLTRCEQKWDYLNCNDAARAFYLIGQKGKNGSIYNIGSGAANRLLEYITILRNTIDKNLELGIGMREYAPCQVMYLCADISNLQADTGFVPEISFEKGIAETIEWYKAKKL